MRAHICFQLNDEVITLDRLDPTTTLLDFIRERKRLTGTKEGCNEGDCGACTVALGRLVGARWVYRPVNACIQLVGMMDGCHVVTVEHLRGRDGGLHPVQAAMVRHHGSQCGFCTPGIVMSLYCLSLNEAATPSRDTVDEWLAGNLCRCTGYRPIVDAAMEACFEDMSDARPTRPDAISDNESIFMGDETHFFASPVNLADALGLYHHHPDATPVAGATDVGLWVTKRLDHLPKILHLGRIADFNQLVTTPEALFIGAGVTYEQACDALSEFDPDIRQLVLRIGSRQVRASGTIGGNIANGSPIGDMPPLLIALGATLHLQTLNATRDMPLEAFFLDYGKQDRRPGELVTGITVPRPAPGQYVRVAKVSKRFDQDISAVMAAFVIGADAGQITFARIAYGGMAGVPKRAHAVEHALLVAHLDNPDTWQVALQAFSEDFIPLSDMRASAAYRMTIARNLLRRTLLELGGAKRTRVIGQRDDQMEAAQ